MEPIFGTLASESHSLSTINIPVVTQIEENEEISESHFAFYASKLLTFKYGGRYLTSSMFPLLFNKNNKKWCESVHSFGSLVLGMMLKRRNLIKAVFVEPASSSSSSSSSSLDVYVTPKRIMYERYLLEELTADTSPTSAQLQDGLASIGVAVDAYNNGATPNESEWVAQIKAGALWKVAHGTSSYIEVAEPVDPRSFPFWTRINVEEVRRKFAFNNIAGNFVTAADMDAWFPVASQEATEQPIIQF